MKAFIIFLESHLMTLVGRIAEQKHLQAVRDGIIRCRC
jgi:cellobiose-specific phosphotransferase system component IIC